MALVPPQPPVEHPADLVIDVFGTFLGKRSERMVVRWRDWQESAGREKEPPPGPPVVPFPGRDAGREPGMVDLSGAGNGLAASDKEEAMPFGDANRRDDGSPADWAAQKLLDLWGGESEPTVRIPPAARLRNALDGIADGGSEGESREWQERMVPLSRLRSVTISGRGVTISSDLIGALIERGVGLSFLTRCGTPVAQLSAPGLGGTVQTRRSQLAAYHTALGVQLAVAFVRGKLRNQRHQLQYSGKYLKANDADRFARLEKKITGLKNLPKQLVDFQGENLDVVRDKLMGFEGTGARIYWEGVSIILEGRVEFPGRVTRGAVDPINSALNYGYGILYAQVSAAVVNAGLELYAGFLHVDRAGKPALVLDLVEEFRAPVVDRSILAIANQGTRIDVDEYGLTGATRRLVADRVLERLKTPVPYEGKHWPLSAIIQNQARHLAVAVRGERAYQSFASRW
jgi:CRISPR-associated protein Cas1